MASACWKHLAYVAEILRALQPQSVLDVGVGFGKYGFLVREYLDIYNYRIPREEWRIRLDGVEGYEPYLMPHQRYLYDKLYVGDACSVIDTLGEYEMIIAGDMIEHQEKARALALLEKLQQHAQKWVLISIPLGRSWPQDAYRDNQYDEHRSDWTEEELRAMGFDVRRFRDEDMRPYGVALLTRPGARRFRAGEERLRAYYRALRERFPQVERLRGLWEGKRGAK